MIKIYESDKESIENIAKEINDLSFSMYDKIQKYKKDKNFEHRVVSIINWGKKNISALQRIASKYDLKILIGNKYRADMITSSDGALCVYTPLIGGGIDICDNIFDFTMEEIIEDGKEESLNSIMDALGSYISDGVEPSELLELAFEFNTFIDTIGEKVEKIYSDIKSQIAK